MQRTTMTLAALAVLGLAGRPAAAQQTLYVATGNTIDKISSAGAVTRFSSGNGANMYIPRGLAFDSAGNLYAANYGDFGNNPANGNDFSYIQKFTPGGAVTTFYSGTSLSYPNGLAFDASGNLYAANTGNGSSSNSIEKITPDGVATTFYSGSGVNDPYGLAFDTAGNLYAANYNSSTIEKFTPDGTASLFYSGSGVNGPRGLAFDSAGNLYAANNGAFNSRTGTFSSFIEKITPDGVASTFYSGSGLNSPRGLAFDAGGNLYAANYGSDSIEKITPGGTASRFATDGNGPYFLAFGPAAPAPPPPAAAPEPSEWAALGFTGLGVARLLWRARRRSPR